jgi:hypothetical protein
LECELADELASATGSPLIGVRVEFNRPTVSHYFLRITRGLRRGRGFRLLGGNWSDGAITFVFSLF